ncbi:unnamed protein product [Eretmochelys imbricata]
MPREQRQAPVLVRHGLAWHPAKGGIVFGVHAPFAGQVISDAWGRAQLQHASPGDRPEPSLQGPCLGPCRGAERLPFVAHSSPVCNAGPLAGAAALSKPGRLTLSMPSRQP